MPTNFDNSFNPGDIVEDSHIKQVFDPIHKLEKGEAFYAEAAGPDDYQVDFSNDNAISIYSPGLLVNFKAVNGNSGASTLTVTGPSGALSPIALTKRGGNPLEEDDIADGQIVSAIYTDDVGGPRFEIVGGLSGSSGLSDPEWAIFDLLSSDLTMSDLSNQDVPLGSRSDGVIISANANNRVALTEGVYDISFSVSCDIVSGDALEVGIFDYSGGGPVELVGSTSAIIGDEDTHYSPVGHAVLSVSQGQTKEIGLRTGSRVANGTILSGEGFFKVLKMSGGVSSAGAASSLDQLSDVGIDTTPNEGDVLQFDSASGKFKNTAFTGGGGVSPSRLISTSAPLAGGGDLTQDLTLSMPAADGFGQDGYISSAKFVEFDAKEDTANKGQAGGYAGLGVSGSVPLNQGGTGASDAAGARANLEAQERNDLLDDIAGLSLSGNPGTVVTVNAGATGLELAAASGQNTGDIIFSAHDLNGDFLECNGQVVSQSSYPNLYALIGLRRDINSMAHNSRWASVSVPGKTMQAIAVSDEGVVVVVGDGCLYSSSNGTVFTSRPISGSYFYDDVIWVSELGLFVVTANNGVIYTSPDGATWTLRQSSLGSSWSILGITWGNGLLVVVGKSGRIRTSSDGVSWTNRTSGVSGWIFDVAYGRGMFVAVGDNGILLNSRDGITWTDFTGDSALLGTSSLSSGLHFNEEEQLFLGAAYLSSVGDDSIYMSPDGYNWSLWADIDSFPGSKWETGGGLVVVRDNVNNYDLRSCAIAGKGDYWQSITGLSSVAGDYINSVHYKDGSWWAAGVDYIHHCIGGYSYNSGTEFVLPEIKAMGTLKAWVKI